MPTWTWPGCPARSSCPWRRSAWPRPGATRAWSRSARWCAAPPPISSTSPARPPPAWPPWPAKPACRSPSGCSPPTPWSRRWTGPAARPATRERRRRCACSRWPPCWSRSTRDRKDVTEVLKVVLPKGSLERATLRLFEAADLPVERSSDRAYHGTIADPRVERVSLLRPQEIPRYVEEGFFDLGITGRDWIEETGSKVASLAELPYSKQTANPVRVVLAVHRDLGVSRPEQLRPDLRVSTEFPNLTRRFFAELGVAARIFPSYGATEAKVPEMRAPTGTGLAASGSPAAEAVAEKAGVNRLIPTLKEAGAFDILELPIS